MALSSEIKTKLSELLVEKFQSVLVAATLENVEETGQKLGEVIAAFVDEQRKQYDADDLLDFFAGGMAEICAESIEDALKLQAIETLLA